MHMFVVKDRFQETPDKDFDTIEDARLNLTERSSQGYAVYLFIDNSPATAHHNALRTED